VLQVTVARDSMAADRTTAPSSVAKTYRQMGSDGTPHYTNMPPLVRTQPPPPR
jgi:hypothetical protein